jgi:murein DD-endopeptidase MepM/ murein hydrolase activator NlpD
VAGLLRLTIAATLAACAAPAGAPDATAVPPSAAVIVAPRGDVSSARAAPQRPGPQWLASTLDEREAMYVRLAVDLAPRGEPTTFTGKLANWPIPGRISSPFGPRWGGFHNGLDVAAPLRTPVVATLAGQVVAAGKPYLAYGDTATMVILAHGSAFSTLYVHLDDSAPLPVTVGQRVKAGDVVGYVGLTGWTTGPHIHFMTVTDGRAVDPRTYLP